MAEQTDVPEEIQNEYYENERGERTGVAWVLAFVTLIATVLIATGVFFAGRWVYRQIAGDDTPKTPSTAQNEDRKEEAEKETQQPAADDTSGTAEDGTPAAGSNTNGHVAGDATAHDEELPDTGPSHTLAAFLIVSVLGYVGHRALLARS